jgi:hypothetical protein
VVTAAAAELLHLRPHIGEVDGRGDERGHREDAGYAAVSSGIEPEHEGDAEDDQPDRLAQLANRAERLRGPDDGVDEGPGFHHERRHRERYEEVIERAIRPAAGY